MRLAWSFEPRMLPQIQQVQKSGQAGFQIAELMVKLRHMSDIIIIRNHTLSLKKRVSQPSMLRSTSKTSSI